MIRSNGQTSLAVPAVGYFFCPFGKKIKKFCDKRNKNASWRVTLMKEENNKTMSTYAKPRSKDVEDAIYGIALGEEGALERLYRLASSAIYAYALSITKNVYDAQDIMHDVFVKAYDAAPAYRSDGKPMAWLLTVTKNLCYDKFRQQSRFQPMTEQELDSHFASVVDVTERLTLNKCLFMLTSEESSIVIMHAVGGLKHREIAEQMQIPLATVLSKYNRAIKKLRGIIKGDQDE